MKQKLTLIKIEQKCLIKTLLVIFAASISLPSKAFIPYVYEPNQKELEKTAIIFGKTAAHFLQFNQPKEAIRRAKLAVKLKPKDYLIWSILGEAQRRSGLLKTASISLATATKLNPKNSVLWFTEAALALQRKEPRKAIFLLEKGLEIEPKNSVAYFQIGNARIMQMKPKIALKAFKKATSINPNFWEALNNQGIVLFEMNKKLKAIKIWREVLNIEPNAEPMLALGAALNVVEPGNPESIELAKKALAKDPNYISSLHQEEQLWGKKLQTAANELLKNPKLTDAVEQALANSDAKIFQTK